MTAETESKERLPAKYEKKYKNQSLKNKIVDPMMWSMIPGVSSISTRNGQKRLKENDALFSFIDRYLSDVDFAFEPVMSDGRFVCLPPDPAHQGFGVCVSKLMPETHLEICHFWYPWEFTEKSFDIFIDQLYKPSFLIAIDNSQQINACLEMIKRVFSNNDDSRYCTFAFSPEKYITFQGNFLDDLKTSENKIRELIANQSQKIIEEGEITIGLMNQLMQHAH